MNSEILTDLQIALRIIDGWAADEHGYVTHHKDVIRKAVMAAIESARPARCDYQSVFVKGQCDLDAGHSGLHRIRELEGNTAEARAARYLESLEQSRDAFWAMKQDDQP